MKLFLKRLLTILSTVAAVTAVVGLILILCGYRPFVIDSSSMEPLFAKGSLSLIDTRASLSTVEKGDVLAYRSEPGILVFHRLISIEDKGDGEFLAQLQGDANNTYQTVTLSRVNYIGKEAFTIPGLGSLVSSASGILPVLVVLLILLACAPRLPRFRLIRRLFSHFHILPWKKKSQEETAI